MDAVRKYFCPRLVDYVVIVGARQPSSRNHVVQTPELLRRYPVDDHKDFPLPPDVVFFCQPEGCVSVGPKRTSLRESDSFVFSLTEKDTSRVRYGICVNFYRPINRKLSYKEKRTRNKDAELSSTGGRVYGENVCKPLQLGSCNTDSKSSSPRVGKRNRIRSHSLTSMCIISHHPFFTTFRKCLFTLRKLIDSSNEKTSARRAVGSRQENKDCVWSVFMGQWVDNLPGNVLHEVKEIETWVLKLLSAPVPVPEKTRVEVEILPKDIEPPFIFALPDHTRFSLVDFPLHLPLELLGVDTCIKVMICIMLEHKLVLQSKDYNALSMSVMAFVNMIYPLEYMFPVIPLLPTCMASAEQLLLAPTPFIIGIPASFLKFKRHFRMPDDVWLIDLDSNKVIKPSAVEDLPPLPEIEGAILQNHLQQALSSMCTNPQPIKNLDKIQPGVANQLMHQETPPVPPPPSSTGFNPLIYGNDVDSVDVATRVAMVRFFNSPGVLAHFMEHTRTLRLYPRPVVAFQVNSFLRSRDKVSQFLRKFVRTQAVEFYAEWSLCPTNVAFLRVHTGVFDPSAIGDKAKWFSHQLIPITFQVWSEGCSLKVSLGNTVQAEEPSTDESGTDSDEAGSTSSSYSSLSDFVCEMVNSEFRGDMTGMHDALCTGFKWGPGEDPVCMRPLCDYKSIFHPPDSFQLPESGKPLKRTDSAESVPRSLPTSSSQSSLSSGASGHGEADVEDIGFFQSSRLEGQDPSDADQEVFGGFETESFTPSHTPSTVRSVVSPLPPLAGRSPADSVSSDKGSGSTPDRDVAASHTMQRLHSGSSLTPEPGSDRSGTPSTPAPTPSRTISISSVLSRAGSIGGSTLISQNSQTSLFEAVAREAKEVAREASKAAAEVSRTALEATKPAREAGKKTLLKALSDREKQTADSSGSDSSGQTQSQTHLHVQSRDSGSLMSTFSSELNGFAAHTSNVISGFFGSKMAQGNKAKERAQPFGPFPKGRKGPVEKTPLIKHSTNQQKKQQEVQKSVQSFEARTSTHSGNQQFLKEVINEVLAGEGVKWFRPNRLRKLMEDESYRNLVVSKLNKTLERKVGPDDHIDDVCISRNVYKGMLKVLQLIVGGLEQSFKNFGLGGMASAIQVLEIAHTHYWARELSDDQRLDTSTTTGASLSQGSSPFGSGENLSKHLGDPSKQEEGVMLSVESGSANSSPSEFPHHGAAFAPDERGAPDRASQDYSSLTDSSPHVTPYMNVTPSPESSEHEEATDMFRSIINAKRIVLSRITSVESEVSDVALSQGSDLAVPSCNASDSGSMTTNPAFYRPSRASHNSYRSTVSDSEIEAGSFMMARQKRTSSIWSSKSTLSAGFRYHGGNIITTGASHPSPESTRTYLFEGLVGKDRSNLWDEPQFWEDAFFDAVAQERDLIGMDQRPGEMMERYQSLSEMDKKRLEHDEDKLLATMLYNMIAFMVMVNVIKNEIRRKARRLLGKCHISLVYSAEVNELLDQLDHLHGNDIDLKPLGSRQMTRQTFTVNSETDTSGDMRIMEVRDDGIILRGANGTIVERWWYERLVNMTYCPKNKVLCLWRRNGGETQLHKYYTSKCKELYYCIKESIKRAAAARGNGVMPGIVMLKSRKLVPRHLCVNGNIKAFRVELGGEFPVQDMKTGEGGLLQVCIGGVGLLFANSKFFVRLENIKRCFTQKEGIFVLEEQNPKTGHIIQRRYQSQMANDICYAVLCVFSYVAAGIEQQKKREHHLSVAGEIQQMMKDSPSSLWIRK